MKVLLIAPSFDPIGQGHGSKRRKGTRYGFWASYTAALLSGIIKKMGHQFEYIDAPMLMWSNAEIVRRIAEARPDIIGISAVLALKDSVIELARAIRAQAKVDAPIFLGGLLATSFGERVLSENPEIDYAVVGEAEETIQELLKKIEAGESMEGVRGIIYRNGPGIVRNPDRPPIKDLDSLPSPDWSIFDLKMYRPIPFQNKRLPIIPYMASRGCSYSLCTFCYESAPFAPPWRRHSPQRVVRDIQEAVERYGVREVAFFDDIFLINERWVLEFCGLLREKKIDIAWSCLAYAKSMTKKMVEAAAKAGCWSIYLGFESANQETLDRIKKGLSMEQVRAAIGWMHEYRVDIRGSFILSLPGESPEKAMNSVRFAVENDLTYVLFLPYFPEYGTPLYNEVAANEVVVDEYKGRANAQYVPPGYKDEAEVMRTIRKAYQKFYLRPAYVWKHLKRIRTPDDVRQYYEALHFVTGLSS